MKRLKNIKVDEDVWYSLARLKLKTRKSKISDVIAELIKPKKPRKSPKKVVKIKKTVRKSKRTKISKKRERGKIKR